MLWSGRQDGQNVGPWLDAHLDTDGTRPHPRHASPASVFRPGRGHPHSRDFRELATPTAGGDSRVRRLLGDDDTPLAVYRKLAGNRPNTSFSIGRYGQSWSRLSASRRTHRAALKLDRRRCAWTGQPPGPAAGGYPLYALRCIPFACGHPIAALHAPATSAVMCLLPGRYEVLGGLRLEKLGTGSDDLHFRNW